MRYLLLFAAWLLTAASYAQIEVPPQSEPYTFVEARAVLPVPDDPADVEHEISWTLPADCDVRQLCDGEELLIVGPPGKHVLGLTVKTRTYITRTVFVPDPEFPTDPTKAKVETLRIAAGIDLQTYSAEFTIGTPEPVPPPGPDPPEPVEEGDRTAYIVRESRDDSPAFQMLTVELRAGDSAKWLKQHGHTLTILDDDETDGQGNRAPALAAISEALDGLALPALVITDSKTGAVLLRATIDPATTTGANVVEAIKRTGG